MLETKDESLANTTRADSKLPTKYGNFKLSAYKQVNTNEEHLAITKGTWNKDEPYLLPIPWTKWPGWGVKVYETRCDSVRDYLRILNEVFAFTEFRAARDSGVDDGLVLAEYLTQYASNQNYVELIKEVIQYNIRGEYDI